MASRRITPVVAAGMILCILAFICMIISICTPNWYESQQERQTGFGRIGIWEACFTNYVDEKDSLGKKYNGCHGLLSFELRSIYFRINPSWLLAVQIMMSLCLCLMIACLVIVVMYFIRCCPRTKERAYVLAASVLVFSAGVLEGISVIMYGVKADTDRTWLPHPDTNYLSWSFGLAVLSAFLALFGGMCLLVEWMRLSQEEKRRIRRQNMSMTSKPQSRYEYESRY